jgi:hypothetical protein
MDYGLTAAANEFHGLKFGGIHGRGKKDRKYEKNKEPLI